ncbi:hypothetical protein [Immundisolibacter sp.]|jgi:hypothetical protein|uniref:hypothetical protein n=1 Tax=Immundisolibacter sp. TaxID=1934948 RepID=UPI003F82AEBD
MGDIRIRRLLVISRRLLVFAVLSLLVTTALFGATYTFEGRLMISWLVFQCGIIGGFVSIQQRLRKIGDEELALLAESWATVLVIPVYGGIFALLLYALFLGGLVQGHLFPGFYVPAFGDPPTTADLVRFLTTAYPSQGADLAKLVFWSFVAGFSERFVPQIIHSITQQDAR